MQNVKNMTCIALARLFLSILSSTNPYQLWIWALLIVDLDVCDFEICDIRIKKGLRSTNVSKENVCFSIVSIFPSINHK